MVNIPKNQVFIEHTKITPFRIRLYLFDLHASNLCFAMTNGMLIGIDNLKYHIKKIVIQKV